MLRTIRADDIVPVGDESSAHEGSLAHGANEAVIVPVPFLKRDEPGAANAFRFEKETIKVIKNVFAMMALN